MQNTGIGIQPLRPFNYIQGKLFSLRASSGLLSAVCYCYSQTGQNTNKKKQPVVIQQAAPSANPTNRLQQATAHPLDLVQQATASSRYFCG
jgi:hypothetical protein